MKIFISKLFLYLGAIFPLPLSHGLGYLAGWCLYLLPGRSRSNTRINLALCLPTLDAAARRRLVRKSLIEMSKTIFEVGALWLRPGKRSLQLIRDVQGNEVLDQALAAGKGVIIATPHQGAWEAAGLFLASRYDITCLYRPLKMQPLDELVTRARGRMGGHYIPANAGGVRTLMKTLKQGNVVAMLPDQVPQAGGGVFAPFFGIPAYTMVLLGRLAEKSAAPVIFVWCERLSWGRGYRLHFREAPVEIQSPDTLVGARTLNRVVEDCAHTSLAQYQWSYRRFRKRPEGVPKYY